MGYDLVAFECFDLLGCDERWHKKSRADVMHYILSGTAWGSFWTSERFFATKSMFSCGFLDSLGPR